MTSSAGRAALIAALGLFFSGAGRVALAQAGSQDSAPYRSSIQVPRDQGGEVEEQDEGQGEDKENSRGEAAEAEEAKGEHVEAARLQPLARITAAQARSAALARVPGTVMGSVLESEDGNLVYDVKVKTESGEREVKVDAGNGKVLHVEPERAAKPAGSATAAPPPPVDRAEGLAEDVQSDVARGAWPAAEAKQRELRSLEAPLAAAGVSETARFEYGRALDALGTGIGGRKRVEALKAGNHVSRIVTGMMAGYHTKIPVEVAYMDVAGRDVLYAAQQGRWESAAESVGDLERRYASVQADVRARELPLDRRVTVEIGQLRSAVAARAGNRTTTLANRLLEDVDRIEGTF
ncbi:MAG: PepSY domain-containing protein [Gemmatimonadales bacterium]